MTSLGSVYQRRSDGRWVASIRLGPRRIDRYARSEAAAREALAALHRELGLGRLSPPTKLTLAEWAPEWLAGKELRPKSRDTYHRSLSAWVTALGNRPLHRLTPALLRTQLVRWRQAGVGKRTLEQRWTYLHGCLEEAVTLGILDHNPLARVPKPLAPPRPKVRWDPEQAEAFLRAALTSRRAHADLPAFLLLTGLRLSEALGLTGDRWDRVEETLVYSEGVWYPGPPKTRAGQRPVLLLPLAQAIVRERGAGPGERIFRTRTGTPPRSDNLSRLMAHLCEQAGVPRLDLRGLRRVHASLLVQGGLDPKSLQAHLGHRRASLSLDVYAYSLPAEERVAAAWGAVMGD